jgi:hypothetical protein
LSSACTDGGAAKKEVDVEDLDEVEQVDLDISSATVSEVIEEITEELEESPDVGDARALLPEYSLDERRRDRLKLSGKVLTDEEAESMSDAIDGVEVSIEVKTRK